jgi:hypothetical protein
MPTYPTLVVMGDLNEVVGLHVSGFGRIVNDFELVDVLSHYHPIKQEVATYARGTTRLDYIFCTSNLLPAVRHCGIEAFNSHIFSDHRGLFVDWDESLLFGSLAPLLATTATRRLQSKNLQAKGAYLLRIQKYCKDHTVHQRLAALELDEDLDWSKVESLDRDVTRGMLSAESHCRYRGCDKWSPALKKARMKVEILKLALSMNRTRKDCRLRIDKLQGQLGELMEIPDSVTRLQAALRLAQRELQAFLLEAAAERKKFLQEKETAATIASDPQAALKWKNLQRAEKIKAMYRKLRFLRTPERQYPPVRIDSHPSAN